MKFGVFDHIDSSGRPLAEQIEDRAHRPRAPGGDSDFHLIQIKTPQIAAPILK